MMQNDNMKWSWRWIFSVPFSVFFSVGQNQMLKRKTFQRNVRKSIVYRYHIVVDSILVVKNSFYNGNNCNIVNSRFRVCASASASTSASYPQMHITFRRYTWSSVLTSKFWGKNYVFFLCWFSSNGKCSECFFVTILFLPGRKSHEKNGFSGQKNVLKWAKEKCTMNSTIIKICFWFSVLDIKPVFIAHSFFLSFFRVSGAAGWFYHRTKCLNLKMQKKTKLLNRKAVTTTTTKKKDPKIAKHAHCTRNESHLAIYFVLFNRLNTTNENPQTESALNFYFKDYFVGFEKEKKNSCFFVSHTSIRMLRASCFVLRTSRSKRMMRNMNTKKKQQNRVKQSFSFISTLIVKSFSQIVYLYDIVSYFMCIIFYLSPFFSGFSLSDFVILAKWTDKKNEFFFWLCKSMKQK